MSDPFIVIMAGGRGERFWPMSRLSRPKHLLPIVGKGAMLRQTMDRLGDLVPRERVLIITNQEQVDAVRELCPDLPAENIVAEPVGRDTAPAVALASILVGLRDPHAVFGILPADHVIHDSEGFQSCLRDGFELARQTENLITIGIAPTHPATGYGYIEKAAVIQGFEAMGAFNVKRFVEKPGLEKATEYVQSGRFFWNAGMFLWTVSAIDKAFEKHAPSLHATATRMRDSLSAGTPVTSVLAEYYPDLERISVDFAIMEKADNVVTLRSRFDWDDVGEWPAVERHGETDSEGNLQAGTSLVCDGKRNLVFNDGERVTALLGVDDLIVVHTADATLVCAKDRAQEIKGIVKQLASQDATRKFI